MADLCRAAKWYAARGAHVFACREGRKEPATEHGVNDATMSLRSIERMWLNPLHNVGIACGPSCLVVLDVDGVTGAVSLDALTGKHEALPITATTITKNGAHY